MFDSVLHAMLLSIFRAALLVACTLPVPYLSTVCATGLSSVNDVCCRDARYAAFRRLEAPGPIYSCNRAGALVVLWMCISDQYRASLTVPLHLPCLESSRRYVRGIKAGQQTLLWRPEVKFLVSLNVAAICLFVEPPLTARWYTTRGFA